MPALPVSGFVTLLIRRARRVRGGDEFQLPQLPQFDACSSLNWDDLGSGGFASPAV